MTSQPKDLRQEIIASVKDHARSMKENPRIQAHSVDAGDPSQVFVTVRTPAGPRVFKIKVSEVQ